VFAIFTADLARRDAIKIEERERPPGARSWSRRSRNLQRQLITRWLALARA
jgi:D-alanyl-D-alanine carboxypeptidase/D-alanyl-D-alanine-endopeptidase (penicillin-binding protein 4)